MSLVSKLRSQLKSVPMSLLLCLCAAHCCNDILQAVITALYPILKSDMALDFAQIGMVTLVYQLSASLLQPMVGYVFDKYPNPYSLWIGITFTTCGICLLAFVNSYILLLFTVAIIGVGSSILHPEASRITSVCSGGRRGLAQSVFQVGGNLGSSIGPLLVAFIVAPYSRLNVLWFLIISSIAYAVMGPIVRWFAKYINHMHGKEMRNSTISAQPLNSAATITTVALLMLLIISKYIYMACMSSYYTFYAIDTFHVTVSASQIMLFVFVVSTAIGTLVGGPFGDKYGRKVVIWVSILGASPFALMLPHMPQWGAIMCSFGAGFMLSSAFPAILLYAQELLPRHLGMVSGLFFGFAFGIGGIASAIIGGFADAYGIHDVFNFCAYSPLLGLIALLLPNLNKSHINKS